MMADRCPHCGADGETWWRLPDEWLVEHQADLSEETRQIALRALELEAEATAIYFCMEENAETVYTESYFRRIARHEETHMHELERLLGVDAPEIGEVSCPEDDSEKFALIAELEELAMQNYQNGINIANEQRALDVFTAFFEVEQQHQNLAIQKQQELE